MRKRLHSALLSLFILLVSLSSTPTSKRHPAPVAWPASRADRALFPLDADHSIAFAYDDPTLAKLVEAVVQK